MIKLRFFIFLSAIFLVVSLLPTRAWAQDSLHIDIFGPGEDRINAFVAPPRDLQSEVLHNPELGSRIYDGLQSNLGLLPFLTQVNPEHILGGPGVEGVRGRDIDFRKFNLSRVDLLLTIGLEQHAGGPGSVEIRAFEVFDQRMILGRAYDLQDLDQVPLMLRRFCAELMEYLTGNGDFFRSRLAFERKKNGNKDIWSVTPQGNDLTRLTDLRGITLSPAWSPDGSRIAFTLMRDNEHHLGIWDLEKGEEEVFSMPGNTVISPAFSPEGRLALSLDPMGRPDIYWLDDDYGVDETIMEHWAIDVSPSFDASGTKMAFASGRLGNPHIFVHDFEKGQIQRVSYEGRYNTNPSISPEGDFVAFTRQTPDGHRIFVVDLETGREKQISSGPGNDEDPAFAPDGYFVAFSSNRSGEYRLYLTTRNGDEPREISTGEGNAKAPAWGLEKDF
ncbi:WD40 domain protein beta Propeller [Desulfonatronospira thiodismutans ASO3-1]|uniref:WD40 domain protein beta Propeller n=1 Tax=Desulfonatronospira thiodismutans ASO3-1 TaxID=555779 RepID=D6SRE0_9BACT|nr:MULTISPECIES: PD40 domain-containing protein [Desulfonatronospira]EFI33256.1 WD40 domain protein beta Propeller [Desulfonatronospira thiodismutans ASO3-1]RQD76154.1 MAG: hypothetical protein D5S03_06950 [Desulfonatronospira sp. MSAO_Bac3]